MGDDADVRNPSAPHGKSCKYARRELELRFLLAEIPPGHIERAAEILDRYLEGTRLRLRKTIERTAEHGAQVFYKLTQKVPAPDGSPGLITTVYLSEDEYERLATIPALVLEKTRFSIPPFVVDVFGGQRAGLFLAEAELTTNLEVRHFAAPQWAIADVTNDVRFTGGRIVTTNAIELATLLSEFGIVLKQTVE
jgi:CYTH domain-containing protein